MEGSIPSRRSRQFGGCHAPPGPSAKKRSADQPRRGGRDLWWPGGAGGAGEAGAAPGGGWTWLGGAAPGAPPRNAGEPHGAGQRYPSGTAVPALTYVVGSVVVGPAIFLGGYESITGGVMDYCDPVHGAPASREARFTAVQSFRHRHYAGCRACPADYSVAHRHRISLLRLCCEPAERTVKAHFRAPRPGRHVCPAHRMNIHEYREYLAGSDSVSVPCQRHGGSRRIRAAPSRCGRSRPVHTRPRAGLPVTGLVPRVGEGQLVGKEKPWSTTGSGTSSGSAAGSRSSCPERSAPEAPKLSDVAKSER